jgi:hypothetical protein
MSRPRITARHEVDAFTIERMCTTDARTSPGVLLEVTFDRGDHQAALRMLERAVADVRRQIADAAEGSGECVD